MIEVDRFFCSLHPWEMDAIKNIDVLMPHPADALPEAVYLIAIGALADPAQAARRAAFETVYNVTKVYIPILPEGFETWYQFDQDIWGVLAVYIANIGGDCGDRNPIWGGPWST